MTRKELKKSRKRMAMHLQSFLNILPGLSSTIFVSNTVHNLAHSIYHCLLYWFIFTTKHHFLNKHKSNEHTHTLSTKHELRTPPNPKLEPSFLPQLSQTQWTWRVLTLAKNKLSNHRPKKILVFVYNLFKSKIYF